VVLLSTTACAGATAGTAGAPAPQRHPEQGEGAVVDARDSAIDRQRIPRRDETPRAHFYHDLDFGSESQFNPFSEILNEGFDMLRQENRNRRLSTLPYHAAARNVFGALIHADSAIRAYGLWNALHDEVFPLSFSGDGGQWVPNYTVHLIGSGMVSARMAEWYEAHGVSHPVAASAVTMFTAHFINESVEDGGRPNRPLTVDPIADIYIFDLGGFLLYRSERVRHLVDNDKVTLTSWGGQPAVNGPEGTLENTTQEFVIRTALPRTDQWRGMIAFGVSTIAGLSYGPKTGTAISLAAGADAVNSPIIDTRTDKKTVQLKPYTGVFVDREGSLLFSAMVRDSKEVVFSTNVYPGVLRFHGETTGLWAELLRDHRWRFGIVPTWGLGLGQNAKHPIR
jgi:hypothetical protein